MTNGDRIIIVVDDEPLIRMDLAETLRAAGFKVVEGQDAADALRILAYIGIGVLADHKRHPSRLGASHGQRDRQDKCGKGGSNALEHENPVTLSGAGFWSAAASRGR